MEIQFREYLNIYETIRSVAKNVEFFKSLKDFPDKEF